MEKSRYMNKRLVSIFLIIILLFGIITTAFGENTESLCKDNVRIIVELEDSPIIDYAIEHNIKVNQIDKDIYEELNNRILKQQDHVKSNIRDKNIPIDYHYTFTNTINGFSATTTYDSIKKIEDILGVKNVTLQSEQQVSVDTSKGLIGTEQIWDLGYKGEGKVISIIDGCIDPYHQDMVLTNPENGKITENDINSSGLPGKYFSSKVPYAYNYVDNNDIVRHLKPDASEHGMHVAGIAGANGQIKGVAPEAQLLGMKVFGNDPYNSHTYSDAVVKAIDDSVALGADVINMSFGSGAGYIEDDEPQQKAIAKASQSGVICVSSAGNKKYLAKKLKDPFSENPDYAVVSSPGLATDSISVASIENSYITTSALTCGNIKIAYKSVGDADPIKAFKAKPVRYVDCNLGAEKDFKEKDIKGNIALVARGELEYIEKIMNAQDAGAIGVIVYNHDEGGDKLKSMKYPEEGIIPALFISNTDGKKLKSLIKENENYVSFKDEKIKIVNPNSGKMADSSSWGPTQNLILKPEITAPGAEIYSTLENNGYGIKSGTSMASPHIAGAVALILEKLEEDMKLEGIERVNMVKNLLMSTANPIEDKSGFISPRKQGAGLVDLYSAISTPAIITDSDTGICKVELKEIDDLVNFSVKVTNFKEKELVYDISGVVQTDLVKEGIIKMKSQPVLNGLITFEDIKGNEIENIKVPPKGSADFNISIDLSNATDSIEKKPLKEIYENGTFIDGFIILKEVTDTYPDLVIPYVGFYGEWDKAPIIEPSLYETDKNHFYELTRFTCCEDHDFGFSYNGRHPDINNIAFSPNGDGLGDSIKPELSFLRTAREVEVNILDKDRNVVRKLSYDEYVKKNYYDKESRSKTRSLSGWEWDGKVYGEVVEGEYIYQINARIDYENSRWQTFEFPIKVDLTPPEIDDIILDKETMCLTIKAKDNMTPIYKYEIISKDKVIMETDEDLIDLSKLSNLPHEIMIKAYDYALNSTESESIIVSEDDTIPYVYVDKPKDFGTFTKNEIEVEGYVIESSNIRELKINGSPIDFKYNSDDEKYYFRTRLNYDDGVHKILIEAKDKFNNTIKYEKKVFVDTVSPKIDVIQRPDNTVDSSVDKVKFKIRVSENSGGVIVKVHGNQVLENVISKDYTNEFIPLEKILEIEVPIRYGNNDIEIIAEDPFGNITKESIGKVYRRQN